jgi:hypothetical protein
MFLKSIATIQAFTTLSTDGAGVGSGDRMKQERLVDEAIGYTEFHNEVYRNGNDCEPCNLMIFLDLVVKMIWRLHCSSVICDDALRKSIEVKMVRYDRECKEISQIYSHLTVDTLQDRMGALLLALLQLIGEIPTQCMVWKMNKYIREHFFPKMLRAPKPFICHVSNVWNDYMTRYKDEFGLGYLDDAVDDFMQMLADHKRKLRIVNWKRDKENLKTSITLMFLIPTTMVPENSKPFAHLHLDQYKIAKLDVEFADLSRLFALCCCLSTTLDDEGNPITFSDHNARGIADWKSVTSSCLWTRMKVPTFFQFLFGEIFGSNSSGKLVKAFFEALVEMVKEIFYLGACKSDAILDAYIDKEAQNGKYSAVLCRGYMLIPRLKKWIKDSACIGMVNMEIHTKFWDELIKKHAV